MKFKHFLNPVTKTEHSSATFAAYQFGDMLDGLTLLVEIIDGKLTLKPLPDNEDEQVEPFLAQERPGLIELIESAYQHLTFEVDEQDVNLIDG